MEKRWGYEYSGGGGGGSSDSDNVGIGGEDVGRATNRSEKE